MQVKSGAGADEHHDGDAARVRKSQRFRKNSDAERNFLAARPLPHTFLLSRLMAGVISMQNNSYWRPRLVHDRD
jgi:hypothetical protein